MQRGFDKKFSPLVLHFNTLSRKNSITVIETHEINFEKFSVKQDTKNKWACIYQGGCKKLYFWDLETRFRMTYKKFIFWLMRNFFYQLKNQKVTGESMCEIEAAAAKDYVKQVKQKLFERGVEKLENI